MRAIICTSIAHVITLQTSLALCLDWVLVDAHAWPLLTPTPYAEWINNHISYTRRLMKHEVLLMWLISHGWIFISSEWSDYLRLKGGDDPGPASCTVSVLLDTKIRLRNATLTPAVLPTVNWVWLCAEIPGTRPAIHVSLAHFIILLEGRSKYQMAMNYKWCQVLPSVIKYSLFRMGWRCGVHIHHRASILFFFVVVVVPDILFSLFILF